MIEPFSLGIIDLGTNSIRLDIYRIDSQLSVERLHRYKEMIRLGEDVFVQGFIKSEVVQRALDAFKVIEKLLDEYNVKKVVAFATCALRNSANAEEFLKIVYEKTGIRMQVISGKQEAALIAKAILNNESTPSGYYGLIDIGGGSTEVSLCYKHKILDCYSFELGSNRIQQNFFQSATSNASLREKESAIANARKEIQSQFADIMNDRNWPNVRQIIGSSGTIRAIWRILRKSGKAVDPFKTTAVERILQKMTPLSEDRLMMIPGMERKRLDIIVPGTLLLEQACLSMGVQDIYISNSSLRDGILDWEIESLLQNGHLKYTPPDLHTELFRDA